MNSRSRSVSAIERMVRAPHAQPKIMMMKPTVRNDELPRITAPRMMRMGSSGMVMKLSTTSITSRSKLPPI